MNIDLDFSCHTTVAIFSYPSCKMEKYKFPYLSISPLQFKQSCSIPSKICHTSLSISPIQFNIFGHKHDQKKAKKGPKSVTDGSGEDEDVINKKQYVVVVVVVVVVVGGGGGGGAGGAGRGG